MSKHVPHTPGPWFTYKNRNPTGEGCVHTIATVESEDLDLDENGTDYTIAGIHSDKPIDQANARLIAAAPELLDSLDRLVHAIIAEIDPHGRIVDAVYNSHRLMTKIKGDTQ